MIDSWEKDMTVNDMPNGDMRLVAELCGIDTALLLMKHLGGVNIYVPKMIERRIMAAYVQRHYDGKNAKNLAVRMGKSIRFVYSLLQENKDKGNGQTSLLDELGPLKERKR